MKVNPRKPKPKPKPKTKALQPEIKSTSKAESDEDVIAQAAKGLGHLCFWDIKGHYKPDELRTKASHFKLPTYVTLPDRESRSCLSAACRKFRFIDDDGKPFKAEIVFEDDFGYTVGLLKRDKPEERKAKWEQMDSVYLEVIGSAYRFSDTGSSASADMYVKLALKELEHYFGNDIRHYVVNPIMKGCRALQLHAGLRFISIKYEKELINLQKFLASIGAEFHVLTQLDNAMTRNTISGEVKKTLSEKVKSLQEKLAGWKTRTVIRSDAEAGLLTELRELKEQTELMQDALQIKLTSLTTALADAREEALEMINERPNSRVKEVKKWQSIMDESYTTEENGETIFLIPKEDWDSYGLKFRFRKTDGHFAEKSTATKILNQLGHYAYVKDNHLVIRPLTMEQ